MIVCQVDKGWTCDGYYILNELKPQNACSCLASKSIPLLVLRKNLGINLVLLSFDQAHFIVFNLVPEGKICISEGMQSLWPLECIEEQVGACIPLSCRTCSWSSTSISGALWFIHWNQHQHVPLSAACSDSTGEVWPCWNAVSKIVPPPLKYQGLVSGRMSWKSRGMKGSDGRKVTQFGEC